MRELKISAIFATPLLIVAAALSMSSTAMAQELVDRIVAVVNGQPILHSEIEAKVRAGYLVTVSSYPADEDAPAHEQALQDAINSALMMQTAEEMEIEFSDAEVEAEMQQFLETRGMNREALVQALQQEGMSYENYRDDFRRQLVFRRFQGMVIRPMIKITDRDIENYFLRQTGSSTSSLELTLRQILVRVPSDAVDDVSEGKQRLARDIHQKLRSGMEFSEAVKIYSDDQQARTTGGLMRNIRLDDLAPQIRQAVEELDVNEFSRPVQTQLGFHIFLLEDKKFTGSSDFTRQRNRLETELLILESEMQTRRWLADQRKRSEVRIIP